MWFHRLLGSSIVFLTVTGFPCSPPPPTHTPHAHREGLGAGPGTQEAWVPGVALLPSRSVVRQLPAPGSQFFRL